MVDVDGIKDKIGFDLFSELKRLGAIRVGARRDILCDKGRNQNWPCVSFKPDNLSIFPLIAASVKTLVVSWNEAADINEFVCNDAFVIPSRTLSNTAEHASER
mgnify:CR=1 FL=1